MPKQLISSAFALLILAGMPALFAGGSVVPVGTYLYADLEKVPAATGSLELRFTTPGPHRLVIAFGRKYRKDSKGREGTTEPEREAFKPRLAELHEDARCASSPNSHQITTTLWSLMLAP
jgi:hypothetical protein